MARQLAAGRIRLGMRLANDLEVVEIVRPHRDTVKRGYGRMWIGFDNGSGWHHFPHDWITLAEDEDAPADHTMDDWRGRWWSIEEQQG